MVIIGAGINHWYHQDMTYRGVINLLVMCGTNDAYRLPTVQQFQDQAAILREKIRAIGARPVFWDCSVCDKNYVDGDRLIPSRVLAIGTDYNGPAPYPTA